MNDAASSNPYRAPGADSATGTAAAPAIGAPRPWDPIGALAFGWGVFRRNPVSALVVFVGAFIGALPNLAGGVVQLIVQLSSPGRRDVLWLVLAIRVGFVVLGWPLTIWISLGIRRYLLNLARGRSAGFTDLFSAGACFLGGIGASLALLAVGAFALVPCVAPAFAFDIESPAFFVALAFGICVFAIAATVFGLGVQLYEPLIVDARAGALDSLTTSWRLTRGHKPMLFVLALLGVGLMLAATCIGLVALCAGIAVTLPVGMTVFGLAQVYVYLKLTGEEPAPAAG